MKRRPWTRLKEAEYEVPEDERRQAPADDMQSDDERMMYAATRTVAVGKSIVRKAWHATVFSSKLMAQLVFGFVIGGAAALAFRYFTSQG